VGIAIIPIIKKSVDWWQTLHQPSTFSLTSSPSMSYEMYLPLAICVVGFYLLFVYILLLRLRVEILYRERDTSWVKDYLNQRIG
jgi:heme exporter protein C